MTTMQMPIPIQYVLDIHSASGGFIPASELANRWVAHDDARHNILLGDPAVRVQV